MDVSRLSSTTRMRAASIIGSPRLRRRLAHPCSQARLAYGGGSHTHVHRLASPTAAARTPMFTGSPRLRRRLAHPCSQARLAYGGGSHTHVLSLLERGSDEAGELVGGEGLGEIGVAAGVQRGLA